MRLTYLPLVIALSLLSCRHDPIAPTFDYVIIGPAEVTVERTGESTLPIEVKKISGDAEKVALTFSELPQGVSAGFANSIIVPDAKCTGQFTSFNTKEGDYFVKLLATTSAGHSHSYDFLLRVIPTSNCIPSLIGEYFCNRKSSSSFYWNKDTTTSISIVSNNSNSVFIKGLIDSCDIIVNVDCNIKTIGVNNFSGNKFLVNLDGNFLGENISLSYLAHNARGYKKGTVELQKK